MRADNQFIGHKFMTSVERKEATDKIPQRTTISSKDLLKNGQELIITHAGEEYRLRITSNNKLILTK